MDGTTFGNKPLNHSLSKHAGCSRNKNPHNVLSPLGSVLPCSMIGTLNRETRDASDRCDGRASCCADSIRASCTGDDSIANIYDRHLLRVGNPRPYDHPYQQFSATLAGARRGGVVCHHAHRTTRAATQAKRPHRVDPISTVGGCLARVRRWMVGERIAPPADPTSVLSLTSQ
jgi:hypothetical protein